MFDTEIFHKYSGGQNPKHSFVAKPLEQFCIRSGCRWEVFVYSNL